MRIPLSKPDITEEEIEAVASVLRTPTLSLGSKMKEFEAIAAAHACVPEAIAVSSGTAGLHLCMRAFGIGDGDEVIVPSFSFIAVANCALYERARPVFVDVDPLTLNMTPEAVEQAITSRTRAIIVVHTFGHPADMRPIMEITQRRGLILIEDACEAIGAEYHGRRVGSFGDAAVYGFYPNKQITTGEGGMVLTPSANIAKRIRALRNQGRSESAEWFQHNELGYNYRISEVSCALGIGQMKRLEEILARREEIARLYHRHLSSVDGLILPLLDVPCSRISWFVYVVRLNSRYSGDDRDSVIARLGEQGIGCGRYFAPIHLQPMYREADRATSLPVTENESKRVIALPFFNRISDSQVAFVCQALTYAMKTIHTDFPPARAAY